MKSVRAREKIFPRIIAAVVLFHLFLYMIIATLLVKGEKTMALQSGFLSFTAAEQAWSTTFLLLLMGVIMTVSLLFSIFIAFHYLFKPLKEACEYTAAVSRAILGDNAVITDGLNGKAPSDFVAMMTAVKDSINILRERGALLQAIVEGIPAMVYYVDEDYRVLWANEQAKKRFLTW